MDDGVAPLLVIDVQTLETMEGLKEQGNDALTLLTLKALTAERRTQSLDDLIYAESRALPWPTRMRETFGAIGDCLLAWLRTGDYDEGAVDRALSPQIPES